MPAWRCRACRFTALHFERIAFLVVMGVAGCGKSTVGRTILRLTDAIRQAYTRLLATRSTFTAIEQWPALIVGDLALTSTKIPGGATAEVARRQHDGSWLWILDRPNVIS